jgi:hypothetical protein
MEGRSWQRMTMGEKAFSPSRFLVRQGGKGWMFTTGK